MLEGILGLPDKILDDGPSEEIEFSCLWKEKPIEEQSQEIHQFMTTIKQDIQKIFNLL